MKILAVDTSAKSASVAIADENTIIGSSFINTKSTHSQTLIPMIEELLNHTNTNISELDAIAVNNGPGSFTGIRIGVAAVKGLCFNDNIKCIAVSTLYSMAYNVIGSDTTVCAVMDARRSQVYNALIKVNGKKFERLCEDRALSLEELLEDIKKRNEKVYLIGDGAEITYNYMKDKTNLTILTNANHRMQNAESVALAAIQMYNEGKTLSPEKLMPLYLRLPQAERELNKKLGAKQ